MKYIYSLHHSHPVDNDKISNLKETVFIGFFSSYEIASNIIIQYKEIIGFKDYPDGFYIEKVPLDYDDYDFI